MAIRIKGLDIAYPPRNWAEQLAALGYEFIGRYCPYFGDQGKSLSRAEADNLLAAGIDILMFFQTGADSHRGGFERGVQEAHWWLAGKAFLNIPDSVVPVFCVDFDAGSSDYELIERFQRGAISILGLEHVGIYGHDRVIDFAHARRLASTFVQCRAYSGTPARVSPHTMVFQDVGPDILGNHIDHDVAFTENYGQWKAGGDALTKEDIVALFGSTERYPEGHPQAGQLMTVDERYETAKPRYDEAIASGRSLLEQVGNANAAIKNHTDNHPSSGPATGDVAITGTFEGTLTGKVTEV